LIGARAHDPPERTDSESACPSDWRNTYSPVYDGACSATVELVDVVERVEAVDVVEGESVEVVEVGGALDVVDVEVVEGGEPPR
jgi:hypothetical protein